MPELWERIQKPGQRESHRAYQAFCLYRDMGAQRSIRNLFNSFTIRQTSDSQALVPAERISKLWSWSAKYDWPARAQAWDSELERQSREAQIEAVREMAQRQVLQGVGFQATAKALAERADQYIQLLRVATVETIDEHGNTIRVVKTNLTPQEIAALLRAAAAVAKVGVDMERLARGEATERVDVFNRVRELAKELGLSEAEEAEAVAAAERIVRGES